MTTARALYTLLALTLRLFWRDPFGMLAAAAHQLTFDRDGAQARLRTLRLRRNNLPRR